MRILIVDDHILFREGLASILEPEPDIKIVGMAGTVREAVETSRTVNPDIILMDFGLPDGTSVEATRLILDEFPEQKIVFLTISDEDEDLFSAIRIGAKGYLLKDLHPQKLIDALRSVQRGESALSRYMTMRVMEEFSRTRKSEYPLEVILTRREVEVLRAIASGLSNLEIAKRLSISESTVKYHVHSILGKLNLSGRKEAAMYALDNGLIK